MRAVPAPKQVEKFTDNTLHLFKIVYDKEDNINLEKTRR